MLRWTPRRSFSAGRFWPPGSAGSDYPLSILYRTMGAIAKAAVREGGPEQVTEHPCDALHHHSVQYTGDAKPAHPSGLLGNFDSKRWRRPIGSFEQLALDRFPLRLHPVREPFDVDAIDTGGSFIGSDLFHASVILALDTRYSTDDA
jgi:hypothetical protein